MCNLLIKTYRCYSV